MILADKIIKLRKKNGWSQEELADKMNVSRQAVSKWEAAQTTPDLEKILQLGNLFGVTTDYLLKDEMEDEEFAEGVEDTPVRKISLAQANEYIEQRKEASKKIAIATFLCIVSVIPLLLLTAISQFTDLPISEDIAAGIGVVAIFPIVAIAVMMFVRTGFKNAPYEFLEEEPFETEYGVTGLAKERQKEYRDTYMKCNYIGVGTCVLSPVPLLCGTFAKNELLMMILLCVTILMVGIGTMLFIVAGVRWASLQKLLKEGDYAEKGKKKSKISESIETVYWLAVTAIYLCWSFLSGDWNITWVVWPVAGVLSAGVELICKLWLDKKE
ncbi:MAG: helix-turn-helix domain-containing protein [Oscillospiraceae bacterium]|nr:helix-turn-helix domain-containing protein [Oscillospiraceae bacterium]